MEELEKICLGKGWEKMKIRYMTNSCVLGGLDGLWKSLGLHLEEQRKTAISDMNSCVLREDRMGLGRAWEGLGMALGRAKENS